MTIAAAGDDGGSRGRGSGKKNSDARTASGGGRKGGVFEPRPCLDHCGKSIRVGDVVSIPAAVTGVDEGGLVNVTMETLYPLRPGMLTTTIKLSSDQLVIVDSSGWAEFVPSALIVKDTVAAMDADTEGGQRTINEARANRGMSAIPFVGANSCEVVRSAATMHGVFYSPLNPGDFPIALFIDPDDALHWKKSYLNFFNYF